MSPLVYLQEEINRLGGFNNLADNDDQRAFILVTLLHTSDLYNPIKPFHITKKWANRLQREFNQQVSSHVVVLATSTHAHGAWPG